MKTLYKITLFLVFGLSLTVSAAAQTEREQGIDLYNQGKNTEAIALLEKAGKQKELKDDAELFNYLGMAYLRTDDLKRARKWLEKTVKLSPQNAAYRVNLAYAHLLANRPNEAQSESTKAIELDPQKPDAFYIRGMASLREGKYEQAIADSDRTIALDANYSLSYLLKSDALFSTFGRRVGDGAKPVDEIDLLKQSKETLENCMQNCGNNREKALQAERLEGVKAFYDYYSRRKDQTSLMDPPPAPNAPPDPNAIKILSKPFATYTEKARREGISGVVRLAVLFAESGRVTHVLVLKGLDPGLNSAAIQAARGIKFEPAKENGKPVSKVKIVEYSFSVY